MITKFTHNFLIFRKSKDYVHKSAEFLYDHKFLTVYKIITNNLVPIANIVRGWHEG
jgi:hypothetical protein